MKEKSVNKRRAAVMKKLEQLGVGYITDMESRPVEDLEYLATRIAETKAKLTPQVLEQVKQAGQAGYRF